MHICGFYKTTLLDYPGKVAATIFLGGCNFRCPFCHNGDLVLHSKDMETYEEEEILSFLKKRKNVLEGVCITGGEPTLWEELLGFIRKIKELGYLVKLDTNGSNPEMLTELMDDGLLDYIAMDVKAPSEDYEKLCGVKADMEKIDRSIQLIKQGKVSYEFRTTVVSKLHTKESILKIGKWLRGAENYYLQSYQETEKNICKGFSAMKKEELFALKGDLEKEIKNVKVRGVS